MPYIKHDSSFGSCSETTTHFLRIPASSVKPVASYMSLLICKKAELLKKPKRYYTVPPPILPTAGYMPLPQTFVKFFRPHLNPKP